MMDGERDWQTWQGVSGIMYARLVGSSPPVVVQAPHAAQLGWEITRAEVWLRRGSYWPDVLASRQKED